MKTKINLLLLTALFAGFALVSCDPKKLPDDIVGEFPPIGGEDPRTYYSIELTTSAFNNPASTGEGYVRAYIKDSEGNATNVNRAAKGDVVWIRASAYAGFEFMEWVATNVTLSEKESDEVSFTMPESNVAFEATFDDLSVPPLTPFALINDSIPAQKNLDKNVKLRAWKARQVSQVFVWFDAWSGRKGAGANSMRGLPNEVSIIANWGQPKWELLDWQKADMKYVQEVKGAKVVVTLFSAKVGEDVEPDAAWSSIGTSSDEAVIRPVIAKYAKVLYDKVMAEGYDGFDWDFEPDVSARSTEQAPLWRVPQQAGIFLEELSYWFGNDAKKKADRNANGINRGAAPTKDLLLLVDGEVHDSSFRAGVNNTIATTYVDYYVQQAYGVIGISACQARINGILTQLQGHIDNAALPEFTKAEAISRCILTENFENGTYASTGNGIFDMATVKIDNLPTGGFGAYRVGLSYKSTTEVYKGSAFYTHLRKAIDMQYGEGPRE